MPVYMHMPSYDMAKIMVNVHQSPKYPYLTENQDRRIQKEDAEVLSAS